MKNESLRDRFPGFTVPLLFSAILSFLISSCQVTEQGKEVNTLSFTALYDSLKGFDAVVIVVKDGPSGAVDTIFNGKVDAVSKIQGLNAPHYAGKSAAIEIIGINGGVVVSRVVRSFDGTSDETIKVEVIQVTVTPGDSVPVPTRPAAPTVSSLLAGDAKVSVSWSAVAGAEEYNLYYGEGGAVDKNSTRVKKVVAPYEVKSLKNGTSYGFALASVNAAGESDLSPVASAIPMAALADAPVIDTVLSGNGQVTFSWRQVPEALGYVLYYKAGATVTKAGTRLLGVVPPYTLTGLANGTQYAFALAALTGAGESGLGNIVTATPMAPAAGGLAYAVNPAVYWVGRPIAPNAASLTGTADSFSVFPALPAGLVLDKSTGAISGTATVAAPVAEYTVKAKSPGGEAVVTLSLTTHPSPSGLSYKDDPAVYWQGIAIATNSATVTGIVDSFSVSPSLPSGLTLSRTTGAISGTPGILSPAAKYVVSAHNPAGIATVEISVQVNGAPSGFHYGLNPALYWQGVAIATNPATISGAADSFTVAPALPDGLSLNKATGAITGTPLAPSGPSDYVVTVRNASGSPTVSLNITVKGPPSGLSYTVPTAVYHRTFAIAANAATVTGAVDSFTVSPALPSGLTLNKSTGTVSGTPTALSAASTYTVTARNPAGSATATLSIAVLNPISALTYAINPAAYWKGVAITANTAVFTGTVDSFTVAPALPTGLSLDKATGAISGTPAVVSGASEYVVTANSATGSPKVTLNISVKGAPTGLSYASLTSVYNRTFAIAANAASVIGAVDSFTVSPALPAGLALSKTTGAITGTPTAVSAAANYTVTARNPAGAATVVLSIAVQDPIAGLSYAANPAIYWKGVAIAANAATITGAPDSFTVAPALPAGLLLNKTTGAITGTPTAAAALATYTVTAKTGSVAVTASLVLTVKEGAGALTYLVAAPIYHRTYAITANTASIAGTPDSFTVAPALPAGLALSKVNGALSGTPTVASALRQYTVTAYVGPTTSTARLDITVREPITGFAYSPASIALPEYIAIASPILPSLTGIADSFTVSPALLGGLVLNKATGAISGTPNTAGGPTVHTFTAKGGPVTLNFNLTLSVYTEPRITYPVQSAAYSQGVAILANTPSAVPGGTIDSFKVAPNLPAGLSISKANGSITGTPTATSAATDYVVTAWNKAGTGKDTVSIAVNGPSATFTLNIKAETGLDTGHASGLNVGYSAMTFISKPGQPFFGVYKFDFSGMPATGLKSAKVRYKSYGYGPGWNGNAVNAVTFKVYRIKRAWTEGTGNWFWHTGSFHNGGEVLLTHYPISNFVTENSTDYNTPATGLLYTEHDIVRPANLILCQTQVKNLSYSAASIHPDFDSPVPAPANLVDLEIDMTDYVKGILDGSVTDYGYTFQTEGLGTENVNWIGVMHKEAGDGNDDESDGNFGAKMILTY